MEVLSFLFHIIALLGAARASEDSFIIEKEFQAVTCGSQVKLANKASGYRMHSHEITYSTGSGQQSITAFPSGSDPNSYFTIHGAYGQPDCARGTPFKCNDIVRLQHLNTQKLLHSHRGIGSPLSNIQEVSAYDRADTGDNWKVECSNSKSKVWERETPVSLKHVDTGHYLSSNKAFAFQSVVTGQLEVGAVPEVKGDNERWIAQEGIYFASTSE